jgi:hypothetical protein
MPVTRWHGVIPDSAERRHGRGVERPIPDPRAIVNAQFGVLKEVIEHILLAPAATVETRFGDLPELDEKIRLNTLSTLWASMIRAGAIQAGHVDAYFAKNSTFARQHLRDHLVEQYRQAREGGLPCRFCDARP